MTIKRWVYVTLRQRLMLTNGAELPTDILRHVLAEHDPDAIHEIAIEDDAGRREVYGVGDAQDRVDESDQALEGDGDV